MPIELVPVLGAGIGAGLAMYAVQLAGSAVRRPEAFDAAAFWSSVLRLGGRDPRIAGFFVHLLVSIGVAAGYALGFRLGGITDAGWAWGLVGGIIHWVAAGAFVSVVPRDASEVSPGVFGRDLGPSGGYAFLAAHLVFGLVAGFLYLLLHSSGGLSAAF